jgi:hypothetical protein
MKCFITLLFACTSYMANAQAIPPGNAGTTTLKSAGPIAQHRSQRARYFAVKPIAFRPEAAQFYDAAPTIEMNRFASYVLLYEKSALAPMSDGRMDFRNYERRQRAGVAAKGFLAAGTAILQMNH